MNKDDLELKLISGMPFDIKDCGFIHVPTVREVVTIGEELYNQKLSILLFDKNNVDQKIDDTYTNFDVLFAYCYQSEEYRQFFLDAIEFVFKKRAQMCDVNSSTDAFFYFEDGGIINNQNFDIIQEVVRVGNHVRIAKKEEDEYNPADEVTAKIIAEMLERRKKKPKPKPTMNLHSMISGLAWKSGSPNLEAILNLTMYQLYDGFKRMEQLDFIYYTLFGIYTGNVDSKKVNMKELTFAKIIEN